MIIGFWHQGSGLGNQLFRYIMTRVKALDEGKDFAMIGDFKGTFMDLDRGQIITPKFHIEQPSGKIILDEPLETIDDEFQSEKLWEHRLPEIREWLKVEPIEVPDNLCIINIRGGEYKGVTELELPIEYWKKAKEIMALKHSGIRFKIVTDDIDYAKRMLPMTPVTHEMGEDWRTIRYAKHLILSNSSFAILPALLGDAEEIIAPKFWAGHNIGQWRYPMNEYKRFTYV